MSGNSKETGDEPEDVFIAERRIIETIAADIGTASESIGSGYRGVLEVYAYLADCKHIVPQIDEIRLGVESYAQVDHFVLELLQNADDAACAKLSSPKVPAITFTAIGDILSVSYNEDGFSAEDVKALCSIGRSGNPATDAIEKKGIGFKSVFIACDTIHIGSNGFQFEFDKNDGHFGMVKPKWRPFPSWVKNPDRTLMQLKLSGHVNSWLLQERFEEIENTTLLFLRNIDRIHVYTPGVRTLISCQGRGESTTTITTRRWFWDMDPDNKYDWEPPNVVDVKYIIFKHIYCCTGSEIVLAFPLPTGGLLWPPKVHNILPVAEYGSKVW